jgi:large subunit ribosomal protein L5
MADETKEKADAKPAASPEQDPAAAAKRAARAAAKGKGGKGKGGGVVAREVAKERVKRNGASRLRRVYDNEIRARLMKELGLLNPMEVPRVSKVVVNMGLGEAVTNPKVLETAVEELAMITGQQPVVTVAKKSIANFKLKGGQKIGACVTLRRDQMFEFLDRLISFALPRVRDFKGVSDKAFDGRGNYTLGLKEQIIFPEIEYDKVDKVRGMNICICTTAKNDVHGKALLAALGVPFRRRGTEAHG